MGFTTTSLPQTGSGDHGRPDARLALHRQPLRQRHMETGASWKRVSVTRCRRSCLFEVMERRGQITGTQTLMIGSDRSPRHCHSNSCVTNQLLVRPVPVPAMRSGLPRPAAWFVRLVRNLRSKKSSTERSDADPDTFRRSLGPIPPARFPLQWRARASPGTALLRRQGRGRCSVFSSASCPSAPFRAPHGPPRTLSGLPRS